MPPDVRTEPLPAIPDEFDEVVDWFERASTGLVLLAEYALSDLERATRTFEARVAAHVREYARRVEATEPARGALAEARSLLRADHAWFGTSNEQLDWFYRIVASDDHAGHRQALGQYGRVFAESLRRHRADERAYLEAARRRLAAPRP